jgi:ATP-binding cassette subfamily B multidrug efflux pump
MADEKKIPKKSEDEVSGKAYDGRLMRRLASYLAPYRAQATISVIAVILKAGSDAVGPYLLKVGLDRYMTAKSATGEGAGWLGRRLSADPYTGLWQLTAIYLTALLLAYAFEFTQTYLMQWTGQKVMFDLRREIFRHMQRMHIGFFDNHAVGRLVTRLTSDVDAINEMFTAGVLSMIDDVFALSVMVVVMLSMNWRLALLTLSVLPAIGVVTHLFRKSVRESYRRVRGAIARINSFTQEHVSGMSIVQLFNREERAYKDFRAVNEQHMIAFKDTIFAYALYYPAVDILSSIAIAFIVWRGGFGVIRGGTVTTAATGVITIGVLSAFIQYSQRFFRPIMDLSEKFNILQAAMAACERIFKLLDTPAEIVSPAVTKTGDASNRIEFRNVWFTYQPLTEEQKALIADATAEELAAMGVGEDGIEWILKDVSFVIEPGQTVAIVGHTGAGKTTLTGLMMRFYDVQHGAILLDGVDLREQDLESLRRHFAVVLQDPFLFTGTIAENIRLGATEISEARMVAAARDVNVLEFVESLAAGFDEPVIERGASLSTGQKQLINFARALAYDPRILILDEATSSVDTETEQKIRSALERMVEGRTSVLIAHRLSTVQRADAILVMHKGQLREFGSHQQLLAKRGIYWKLYQLQYKDQEQGPIASGASLAPELASGLAAGD